MFSKKKSIHKIIMLLEMIAIAILLLSARVSAATIEKIKVGFFAFEGYHQMDSKGNKSGYGYDFLNLMRRYSNVEFEYVGYDKTWEDMQNMLTNGEIDMVTSAHKTEERLSLYDFSMPIGTNSITITTRSNEEKLISGDYSTYNGMKLGLLEGSSSNHKIDDFAKSNFFTYTPVYYSTDKELETALHYGEIDAIATSSLRRIDDEKLLSQFDTEDFYAIVKKGNTALLDTINAAILQMDSCEPDWKNSLYYKNYTSANMTIMRFTEDEIEYIASHTNGKEKVVIGMDNDWAPFCYKNKEEYYGIIPDYVKTIFDMTGMEYEIYNSTDPIFNKSHLLNGDTDVYFGYYNDANMLEQEGLLGTMSFVKAGASFVARRDRKEIRTCGVSKANERLNSLLELEEDITIVEYETGTDLINAVERGRVDEAYLYTFEIQHYMNKDTRGTLIYQTIPTINLELCAVTSSAESHILSSILSKCISQVSETEVNLIITTNLTYGASDLTFIDHVQMYPVLYISLFIVLVIIVLGIPYFVIFRKNQLSHKRQLESKVNEITELNKNLEINHRKMVQQLSITGALSDVYFGLYYANVITGKFETIKSVDAVNNLLSDVKGIDAAFNIFIHHVVAKEQRDSMQMFSNYRTLPERLASVNSVSTEYESLLQVGKWCRASWIALDRDADGNVLNALFAVEEVTESIKARVAYETELKKAKEAAEQTTNAKTIFLNNMSHDIRTPMNAILGFSTLMEKAKDDPETVSRYNARIQESGRFLLNVINNVLDMARIESGKMELDENFADLLDPRNDMTRLVEAEANKKHQSLTSNLDIQHPYVMMDVAKVTQVIVNLLSNAIKYTQEGGVIHLDLKEAEGIREGYGHYILKVTDNGIGMSREFLEHIFDSFSRERNTTDSKVIGTGLGMSIVKKLVDFMEGTISVESEPGKGSTFTVVWDFKLVDNPEEYIEKEQQELLNSLDMKGRRILLAEDNDLNAEIATTILEDAGILVERAEDGIICVDMLSRAKDNYYDVVLMDIQMPNLNGYGAARKIRALGDSKKAAIPIIAMTANAFDEDKKNAMEAGMNDHIAKPITIKSLFTTLSKYIQASSNENVEAMDEMQKRLYAKKIVAEMRNNKFLSCMPGGIFAYVASGDEKLIYANKLACEIWGCESFEELRELSKDSFKGLVHPEDYEAIEARIWKQIDADAKNLDRVKYRIIRKDGAVRNIDDYGHLISDEVFGDIFLVFVADITEE